MQQQQQQQSVWEINPIATSKDKIKNPPASEIHAIPRLGSSVLMVGSSGSGKSTLLVSLLTEKRFFKGAFNETLIVSPTCFSDDVQQALNLDPDNCIDDVSQAPSIIGDLMKEQRELIEEKGAHKAPQICLIYDDVIGDRDLLKSAEFVKSFM
jgi:ABC-type dipeptide/oligopeptide/nickel transport system ATPase subunit